MTNGPAKPGASTKFVHSSDVFFFGVFPLVQRIETKTKKKAFRNQTITCLGGEMAMELNQILLSCLLCAKYCSFSF